METPIDFLKTGRVGEWNAWRAGNPSEGGFSLRNLDLSNCALPSADMSYLDMTGVNLANADLTGAKFDGAILDEANLNQAILCDATLAKASLKRATLCNAVLTRTIIREANLQDANLDNATVIQSWLTDAILKSANLNNVRIFESFLSATDLSESRLCRTRIEKTDLAGAVFAKCIVDGGTLLWDCMVDRNTNFIGVGLASARIQPTLLILLNRNIRQAQWDAWYRGHPVLKLPAKCFWYMSDYGTSTTRIGFCFLVVAVLFGVIYALPSLCERLELDQSPSPFLKDLTTNDSPVAMLFLRSLYFSIVTMTTLGFGDVTPDRESAVGHILVLSEVLLGYVLLAALVTRLSILFTSPG